MPVRPSVALVALLVVLAGCSGTTGVFGDTADGNATPSGPTTASEERSQDATDLASNEPAPVCEAVERAPPDDAWAERNALEYRVEALRGLGDVSAIVERHEAGERGTPAARLVETFNHTVGMNRVDDGAVFEADVDVVRSEDGGNESVARNLARADALLASAAIQEARAAFFALDNRSVRFDRGRVCERLADAREASTAGDRYRREGAAADAIDRYRRSWTASMSALDEMDDAVAPTINFTYRADPPLEESSRYAVKGTVYDVRPGELSNVTVVVNGDATTVPLYTRRGVGEPGGLASFGTTVTLDRGVDEISVRVTDESDGAVGRATLLLDGDRLPGEYERNRTSTDPRDPDSDATATRADEGDDGVPDGSADLDGDRLANVDEFERGTDPLEADTDGDGLTDYFELLITDTDPLVADTDGDGTSDGDEDPDGDGLTDAEEERHGSDPTRVDGDGDGLDDPDELSIGTDPILPDTDGDGLYDGRELDATDTDPLDRDTDDDGVPDGQQRHTGTVENASLGVTVEVTGSGDVGRAVTIGPDRHVYLDNSGTRAARVTPLVEVESDRPFDRMAITFEYDPSGVGDPADVVIYRWDPDVQTFVPLESTVYPDEREVTATASTDGTFVAFNSTTWASLFAEPLPEPGREIEFSEEDVTCTGSGQCGVKNGTLYVGEPPPDRTTEPTPTETATRPKSRVVWTNESGNAGGSNADDGTARSDEGETGWSLVEWLDGVGGWVDSWWPG